MILVETSAWVEFDRSSGSAVDRRLTKLIAEEGDIAVTEPVLMEMLAGARDDREWSRLRRLMTSFGWITADSVADFEGAARVYRSCRTRGVTPRGLIDCIIASIALRTESTVLTADRDFAQMALVVPLRFDPASVR
ncbi:MAG TPA: PIN domain nuclease [Acidimicrobiia bacterium]|nr:PIN domain nuclease [Acidimicrobiia bacterium]